MKEGHPPGLSDLGDCKSTSRYVKGGFAHQGAGLRAECDGGTSRYKMASVLGRVLEHSSK